MQNPFIEKKSYSLAYGLAWILIIGIHASVLYFVSDQTLINSIADSLVFNILFAALGLSVWFAVRYYDSTRSNLLDTLLYHIGTAALALALWIGLGYLIMKYVLFALNDYNEFLDDSMPWRAISGLFLYSIMVMVYHLYITQEDRKARIQTEGELQLQVREAEIDRLKSQINPHFLFNSLNSIASLTLSRPEEAREMIVKLSSFLRSSLEYKENEETDLNEELDHIKQYLEIEKIRFGDKLQFTFEIDRDCNECMLPNMILQPLFENAIKHGVYESTDQVEIFTKATLDAKLMTITISNDFDPDMPSRKGKGIGLQNVHNRLQLVYQSSNLLRLSTKANKFFAEIIIPQK